jgi:hypothetical protein
MKPMVALGVHVPDHVVQAFADAVLFRSRHPLGVTFYEVQRLVFDIVLPALGEKREAAVSYGAFAYRLADNILRRLRRAGKIRHHRHGVRPQIISWRRVIEPGETIKHSNTFDDATSPERKAITDAELKEFENLTGKHEVSKGNP